MSFVQQLVGWISGAITSALNEFWNWVTGTLASIFDKVKEVLSGMVKWVWENATNAFNTIIVQPLASGLKAAAAYVMQKLKGTLYIAIVVPLMLREVRGIIEWRSPRDIGLGIAKLLLKPVIARLGVELFWALLPTVLPAPSILQPPTAQPVPPAPPAFAAPPPAARTVQAAWTDALEAAAAAALIAGAVRELRETAAAASIGEIVPPSAASAADAVVAAATGAVVAPNAVTLSDAVSAAAAGLYSPYLLTLSDSASAAATGSVAQYYAGVNLSDSVTSSAALGNSSGIDPFKPFWFYRYYDTSIRRRFWDFFASGEIDSFFTSTSKPSWADNYALFDTVTAYRDVYALAYAIAVCVKPAITSISQETELLYVAIDNGVSALRGAVLKAVNASTLRIYDRGGINYAEFSWNGDWIVVYFPFESKYAYVYDRNFNLLAAQALDDYLSGGLPRHVVTGSSPSSSIKLMIDWVTLSVP